METEEPVVVLEPPMPVLCFLDDLDEETVAILIDDKISTGG
jgi:hypothetical protein